MGIRLERKCSISQSWALVANFVYNGDAHDCAKLLSRLEKGSFRLIDSRWPDDGIDTALYTNGELTA
jgi:hypothetical protein